MENVTSGQLKYPFVTPKGTLVPLIESVPDLGMFLSTDILRQLDALKFEEDVRRSLGISPGSMKPLKPAKLS